ncbi:PKD domain containing protein, partial [Durusdinium trenchii]
YAYACANYAARLSVVDVSDPSSPSILASTEYDAANLVMCEGVAVDGNYAYVTTWSDSASASYLAVVDISDPTSPSIVGSIIDGTLGPAMTIAADEGHVYLPSGTGDGMIVVDVSDPSNPT